MVRITTLLIGIIVSTALCAQSLERSNVGYSGGSAQVDDMYISYTIGEPVIGTISNGQYQLTQGFQQPLGKTSTVISPVVVSNDHVLFPNPTINKVWVDLTSDSEELNVEVYDMMGSKIGVNYRSEPNGERTLIELDLEILSPAVYLVQIKNERGEVVLTERVTKARF